MRKRNTWWKHDIDCVWVYIICVNNMCRQYSYVCRQMYECMSVGVYWSSLDYTHILVFILYGCSAHWWILDDKTDIALGLYFSNPDGRGGHPLTMCQNTKDHLCSIIPRPIRWEIYDILQMILGRLRHHGRVSSSPAPVAGISPQAGAHPVHQWWIMSCRGSTRGGTARPARHNTIMQCSPV